MAKHIVKAAHNPKLLYAVFTIFFTILWICDCNVIVDVYYIDGRGFSWSCWMSHQKHFW